MFTSLDDNINYFNNEFVDCQDIVKRTIPFCDSSFFIIYIDMLTDRETIELQLLTRLMHTNRTKCNFDEFKNDIMTTADIKELDDLEQLKTEIMSGNTVLILENYAKAVVVSTKSFPSRGIQATEIETVVYGAKDAFSESMRQNTALVRRRLRDSNLKVKQMVLGKRSKTDVALMYLDDVVRKDVLHELETRLSRIDTDGILDVGYIQQFVEDSWLSVFPQAQMTERPDKASASILEGRIVVIVDNSPFVLLLPNTLPAFMQSSEDYYERWQIMSFVRVIRYIAAIITLMLPGFYVALTIHHTDLLPKELMLKLTSDRLAVPFDTLFEIIIMELLFELLREAGIRLPNPIGSTIGIVGGIIIGQAAVEAGLIAPIVIIIVALTGITSFAIPSVNFVSALRLLKYFVLIMSGMFGLFGMWIAMLVILIHLSSLESFKIPYLYPFVSGNVNHYSDYKDTVFRFPTFTMKSRPIFSKNKWR